MDAHEAAQMHQNFSQQLLQDHIEACSLPEHNLITVGELPLAIMGSFKVKRHALPSFTISSFCWAASWVPEFSPPPISTLD